MKEEQRRYKAVVFDLDGTLLDTLGDLTDSVNAVLAEFQLEVYSQEEIRSFVGNGIRRLIQRVVPGAEAHPEFEAIYEAFRSYYGEHCMEETAPYPGIMELLEWLQEEQYAVAVVSNKADFAVKKLCDHYFGKWIPVAIGEQEGCRKKPAPDAIWRALEELHCSAEEAVYIGDSEVDLQTAANAQMPCIVVDWGFRSRLYLKECGAKEAQLVSDTQQLQKMLQKQ